VTDQWWPNSNGFTLPSGFSLFRITIDTSAMPSANSMWVGSWFLVGGVWQEGGGVLVTGGTHPQRGGGSSPTVLFEGGIPQNPYPTKARFRTYNVSAPSTITVSGDLE
jgi:hypothetical protein